MSFSSVDLSTYVLVGRYDLPEPTRTDAPANNLLAQEASAVTYDWDTDTLFVLGDGGTAIVQVSKTGELIDTMTLSPGASPQGTDFYDPEGLTYIGNGQFVMTEERDRQVVKFTYAADTVLTRADAETVKLGTFVGNIGLEGVTYDPLTDGTDPGFILVKEKQPESIFQTNIDFAAGTATNGSATTDESTNLFDPTKLNLADIADVYALSNLTALTGTAEGTHLLVLSQESGKILEVGRDGTIYGELTIPVIPGNPLSVVDQQHEGITMGPDGTLYTVAENGGGDFDHPQLWVYAPSSAPNQAPTALAFDNAVTAIDENTSTVVRVKVADLLVTDDGLGTNGFSVSGADAAFFEADNTGLYIKAGTVLDYETRTSYSVTVNVDDTTVGGTPDASADFTLAVNDIINEGGPGAALIISEVAPWSSGNSTIGADWFEVTNTGSAAIDVTGWKMDDNSDSFASAVALSGITSIAAGESVIFIETTNPATIDTFKSVWFGSAVPAGLQIGTYSGSGVGLSTGGDHVNLFDATGALQAKVEFGVSPTGPFETFDNAQGLNSQTITDLSAVNVHGAFVAAGQDSAIGSPGTVGRLFVSEVAPWSSGNSPIAADWFEVTNGTAFDIDISGWKMDDSSQSPAAAVALNGITTIHAGESVIFIETATPDTTAAAFRQLWFGDNAPAGLQIGSYTGSGVGLSTGGDAVNLYDATNALRASVAFGASPASPFATFDNAAGLNGVTLTKLSAAGTDGAFIAAGAPDEVGSPGGILPLNHPPVFTSAADLAAAENQTLAGSIHAVDPDGGSIGFALAGGADAALFAIDAATGALSFKATPDFETREDADGNGIYEVTVAATDSLGAVREQAVHVTVTDVAEAGQVVAGGRGADPLGGTTGADSITGGNGADSVDAGDGDDVVDGGNGADQLLGGRGADQLAGGRGADLISGGAGHDALQGDEGADSLDGGDGNDSLDGGRGADQLVGGAGDDLLQGGEGRDRLTGGEGADGFVLAAPGGGYDVITDFVSRTDHLLVSAAAFGGDLVAGMAATLVLGTRAQSAGSTFLYDGTTGRLTFDADGAGGDRPVLVAILEDHAALAASDLQILA